MSLRGKKLEDLDKEADALIEASKQTGDSTPPEPVAEPEAAISADESTGEQPPEAGETPPVEQPADQPGVSVDEVAKLRQDLEKSEWRYRSLQGMYDKLRDDADELRRLVKVLGEKEQTTPASEPAKTKLVSEKDVEAFGPDLIDLVRRAAEEVVGSKMGDVDGKIDKVGQRADVVEKVVQRTLQDRFESDLAAAVPDWNEINLDPAFADYLGKYGLQALNDAYRAMDLDATAKFFTNYKRITGKVEPAPAVPPPSKSLEDKVAPGKTKSSTVVAQPSARIWSAADINKLYDDQHKNRITPEQFNALEADLFLAQKEGRVNK